MVVLAVVALVSGCGQTIAGTPRAGDATAVDAAGDRVLVEEYFERNNAAASDGPPAQRSFLRDTQHPDFPASGCDLGELTLTIDPTLGTLRPDPDWRPARADEAPRGRVYVVAVTVTVRRGTQTLGSQIGSVHVVVLDGVAHGFAPCPA